MDAGEVLGGVFLLIIGVLCVVPLPLDGWFIWFSPDDPLTVIMMLAGGFCVVFGVVLIVVGVRSKKKSPMREVVGGVCLIVSLLVCFAGLAAESEMWTTIFLVFGVGLLVVGIILVGLRVQKKKVSKS